MDQKVHMLRKELAFLADRRDRFRHDMRELRAGGHRFIINGLSSRDFSHLLYLSHRQENCLDSLRELGALNPTERRSWDAFVNNWLPRIAEWRARDFQWDGGPTAFIAGTYVTDRLARAGLITFDEHGRAEVVPS
jgi:hypothetical protein